MRELIEANPVRFRALVVAVLSLLGAWVPALAGADNGLVEGLAMHIVAGVSVLLGVGAAKRVTLNEEVDAVAQEAKEACCACPHALPEPNEPEVCPPAPEAVSGPSTAPLPVVVSRKDAARL